MYICMCNGITDKDIIEEFKRKKGSVKDTLNALGVGNSCGCCTEFAAQEIMSILNENGLNINLNQNINQKPKK